MRVTAWCAACLCAHQASAAETNAYFNPEKSHHTATGFRNNYVDSVTHSLPTVARWQWDGWRAGLPAKPQTPVPMVRPDLATLQAYTRGSLQHWSGRGLSDESETLWGAWAVFSPALHWYFAGDTGYSRDFADTRQRFRERHSDALGGGFDVALIPAGAYEPRWFMQGQHVNPPETVQIHRDLGPSAA